ncbi:hypothetical protein PCE1_000760 [Barthelona sp. PCE]
MFNILKSFGQPAEETKPAEQFAMGEISHQGLVDFVNGFKDSKVPVSEELITSLGLFRDEMMKLPNVVRFEIKEADQKAVLVGDLHGRYFDLVQILEYYNILEEPEKMPYIVFNGDFVDRGYYSLATVATLVYLRHLYPGKVFLNRGNHESAYATVLYGFKSQLMRDYSEEEGNDIYNEFLTVFYALPLITVVHDSIAVIHGGLSVKAANLPDDSPRIQEGNVSYLDICHTLGEINAINRFGEPDSCLIVDNLLWSDPSDLNEGALQPSSRGMSYLFPGNYTRQFLDANNLKMLVRSHELVKEPRKQHEGVCVTVFSAATYAMEDNEGFVLEFTQSSIDNYELPQFESIYFPRADEPGGIHPDHNPFMTMPPLIQLLLAQQMQPMQGSE